MGKITDAVTTLNETEKIRQEIRHTEAEITETLHSIEGKFTPSHMKEEVKEKLLHYSVNGMAKVTDAIRRWPVSAALVGAGALLFIMRKKRKGKRAGAVAVGAAAVEAPPEKVKREPVKTVRHYVTIGRMVLGLGSLVGMALFREKQMPHPHTHTEMPPARVYPH